ncbi:MAG: hypothetical protein QOE73_250 [Verrucomicrobiota bacterium]
MISHRHWVIPRTAPRLTACQAFQTQPTSLERTVHLHRFRTIRGATRFESTAHSGSAYPGENGREGALINANKNSNQPSHQAAKIEARFARRNHSSSNSRPETRAAGGRAIVTIQRFSRRSCWCLRTISRKRRRTRLRTTAVPIRFDVTKPARRRCRSIRLALPPRRAGRRGSCAGSTPMISNLPRSARPSFLTRSNSSVRVRRLDLGKESARLMRAVYMDSKATRSKSPPARSRQVNKNRCR